MNDAAALSKRIQEGDLAAEDEFVRRCGTGVLVVLRRATRSALVAQDLFQETFRLALEKIRRGELREPDRLPAFLCGLARNLATEHYRRESRRGENTSVSPADTADAGPGPLDRLLAKERAELVRQVIFDLESDRDRQLLLRFYVAEEDKESVCRDLGLSSLHFNRVLFRARQRYKDLYERRFGSIAGHLRPEPRTETPRFRET